MDSSIPIRELTIGDGEAKICVPVVGRTKEEIISQTKQVIQMEPDLIEWRCDYYESLYDEDVEERLIEIREIIKDTPLIFTFRTDAEGGEKFISNDNYYDLNVTVARSGMADIVDIEVYSKKSIAAKLIEEIHEAGCKVIASNHDFEKTPDIEEIESILMEMEEYGPDICKMAVMPKCKKDVETLIVASKEARKKMMVPIVTMSMGALGAVTRICTELTGSAITFASGVMESAPGQMNCQFVREIRILAKKEIFTSKNIMLVGFMGTGKTTVSEELQLITGLELVDVDKYIVEKSGMTIPAIFEKYGEAGFREIETNSLKEIQKIKGQIVSCGGGIVLRSDNVTLMKEEGVVVLLTATPEEIYNRVKDNSDRPLLNNDMSLEHIKSLMEERSEKYELASDIVIDTTGKDIISICYEILKRI